MTPEEAFRLGELHGETQRRLAGAERALQQLVTGLSFGIDESKEKKLRYRLLKIAVEGLAAAQGTARTGWAITGVKVRDG